MSVGGGKRELLVTESSDLCARDLPLKLVTQRETNIVIPQATENRRGGRQTLDEKGEYVLRRPDSPFTYVSQTVYMYVACSDVKSVGYQNRCERCRCDCHRMEQR